MLSTKVCKNSKILICGMKGVGKTTLLEQLLHGNITNSSELHPTIEDIYVAMVDTGRGLKEYLHIYDTSGLQGSARLPQHHLHIADGFILVYNPHDTLSLDVLASIKADIDKNKDKKEVPIIVLANLRPLESVVSQKADIFNKVSHLNSTNTMESVLHRANSWCYREQLEHFTVNALERASLYEPFLFLCTRLNLSQTKGTFPQLRNVMHKAQKAEV